MLAIDPPLFKLNSEKSSYSSFSDVTTFVAVLVHTNAGAEKCAWQFASVKYDMSVNRFLK